MSTLPKDKAWMSILEIIYPVQCVSHNYQLSYPKTTSHLITNFNNNFCVI